ncbi:MAG: serine hydrolase [Candidatus Methylacidiphilales bacterium]
MTLRNLHPASNVWRLCLIAVFAFTAMFAPAVSSAQAATKSKTKAKVRAKKEPTDSVGATGAGTVQSSLSMDDAIQAKAALLYDATSRKILWQRNISEPFPPASTTKLMTALLTYERFGTAGSVTVQVEDTRVEPSSVPLITGETVPIHDLLYSLLLGSDNDTAMALGRATGGTLPNFIDMMNARAKELGCRNTHFASPNGLPMPNQYTTAEDLLRIFQKVVSNPELRTIAATRSFVLKTRAKTETIKNHNRLLGVYPGMDAAKTGWTRASQHTYAASAIRDGRELQLIILQSANKWVDARILFDYGFSTPATAAAPRTSSKTDFWGRGRTTTPTPAAPVATPVPRAEPVPVAPPSGNHAGADDEIPRPARGGGGGTPESAPDPAYYPMPQSPEFSTPANSAPISPAPASESRSGSTTRQPQQTSEPKRRSFLVAEGDTIARIAEVCKCSVDDILKINRIADPDNLTPGLTLIVPDNRK